MLVAVGALIGPSVLGIASNPLDGAGAQLIFTMGVSLILFHGGVGISLRVLSQVGVGLGLLALPGVLITTVIVALVVAPVFGVAFPVALMIGAVLASTDPAILIPLFDRLNIRPKVSQTLISESGFNDTTGAVLTLALVGAVESGRFTLSGPALEFSKELAIGTFIGLLAGLILCYAIASTTRAGIWDEAPGVAILAVVALAYFSNEYVGWVRLPGRLRDGPHGRQHALPRLPASTRSTSSCWRTSSGQVSEIATLLIFVTLGMNLPFEALGTVPLRRALVMAVFIFVARPVTVLACLLPDRRGRWTREELAFLSWSRYTGVIPAAVASLLLARGVEGAEIAVSLVALAVVATLVLQATTAGYVARRLGLIEEPDEA